MPDEPQVIQRMLSLIQDWESRGDQKAVFLTCYRMMTGNMLLAIDEQEFKDGPWVNRLLERFADYYFMALEAYEREPESAPQVWQLAHREARNPQVSALQKMLLGVNAHINYDLALALVDLLKPEWAEISESQRQARYIDHCTVNRVIGATIDAVQDTVLEPAMPGMAWVDRLLGPLDELLISRLIGQWREGVWHQATRLLENSDPQAQAEILAELEEKALQIGEMMGFEQGGSTY